MIVRDFKSWIRYFLLFLLWLWFVLTVHIFYMYIYTVSRKLPVKGGTWVEAGIWKIYYLPYTSNSDSDKFYQSFLFRWCITPYLSWTHILYRSDLCKVETDNWKDFKVYLLWNSYWSDWYPISLQDVYFTYHDILKNNIWNISFLKIYSNIKVKWSSDKTFIKVSFPYPSKDNLIFFTNFILPYHKLKNLTLNQYISEYWLNPVVSNCGRLTINKKDSNSILFDLSNCKDIYLKKYQYKYFSSELAFKKYISSQTKKIVDYYMWNHKFSWYDLKKFIYNNYIVIFFNSLSKNIDYNFKKSFIFSLDKQIFTWKFYDRFVKVFDFFDVKTDFKMDLKKYFVTLNKRKFVVKEKNITILPKEIKLSWESLEFFLDKLDKSKKKTLNFVLPKWCIKLWIRWNSGDFYFLKAYNKWSKFAKYNISFKFDNIKLWKNIYTIRCITSTGFTDWKITLWLWKKPLERIKIDSKKQITIVYFSDSVLDEFIKKFEAWLKKNWLSQYFYIKWYANKSQLEWILKWGNYDIAIVWLYLWLKRDISDIFLTDEPVLNPSRYKNLELKSLYSQYLISSWKTKEILKQQVMDMYNKNLPLLFFWKYLGYYWQRNELDYRLFPVRLYNLWLRKDYISKVKIIYKPVISAKDIFDINKFFKWLKENF